jgi:Fe-S-cluster containining protein
VRIDNREIALMAGHLDVSEFDFIQKFTRLAADRRGLALLDQSNGACVFLDGSNCRVQTVKPQQCRDFPNLWSYPDAGNLCRAKKHLVTTKEWKRRVAQTTGRSEESLILPDS